MSEYTITNNEAEKQYEIDVNGKIAYLEYSVAGTNMILSHTEVPEELEGQGIGSQLVKHVLDDVRERELKILPTCPFVIAFLKRHADYRDLIFGYRPK